MSRRARWFSGRGDVDRSERRGAPNSERTGVTPGTEVRVPAHWISSEEAAMRYAPAMLAIEPANGLHVWNRSGP